jgi:poly(A) polymerase
MDSVASDIDSSSRRDKEDDDAEDDFLDDEAPPPARYDEGIDEANIDPDAVKVISRLNRHGHTAYLVGGGVRDLLLDRRPKDFDVATSARPEEVRRLFRNCRIIGRRFRLAHILFSGGKIIETATFRRDPGQSFEITEGEMEDDQDGDEPPLILTPTRKDRNDQTDLLIRHDNVFGEPYEDAIRRDFTINGLFYDLVNSEVIDYVGGVPDIRRRLVKTIGHPDIRLREDPIRILRAIKFSARLDLGIDPDLYDAIVECRSDLDRAARPRVLEEILRLMRGGAAHRSVYLLWDTGVLSVILPELASWLDDDAEGVDDLWRRLDAVDQRHQRGLLPPDAVLMSALLVGPVTEYLEDATDPSVAFEEFFEDLSTRLTLPRRLKDRIRSVVLAQRRLSTGKLGALPRRDFFADAAIHFAIECEALGREVPEWAEDPDTVAIDGDIGRRRRRRRRRRR